jgi:hypothetical protein
VNRFGRNDRVLDEQEKQATAKTKATADPYGMTNKKTDNGNSKKQQQVLRLRRRMTTKTKATAKARSKGKSKGKSKCGGSSLRSE